MRFSNFSESYQLTITKSSFISLNQFSQNPKMQGGAIYINSISTTFILLESIFVNCSSIQAGGGVYILSDIFHLSHTCFSNCFSTLGQSLVSQSEETDIIFSSFVLSPNNGISVCYFLYGKQNLAQTNISCNDYNFHSSKLYPTAMLVNRSFSFILSFFTFFNNSGIDIVTIKTSPFSQVHSTNFYRNKARRSILSYQNSPDSILISCSFVENSGDILYVNKGDTVDLINVFSDQYLTNFLEHQTTIKSLLAIEYFKTGKCHAASQIIQHFTYDSFFIITYSYQVLCFVVFFLFLIGLSLFLYRHSPNLTPRAFSNLLNFYD